MNHSRDAILSLKTMLAELQQAPRSQMSTRDAVAEMSDTIRELQGRGFSLKEIATILTERGMRVSPHTLRAYLRKRRGRARARSTNRHTDEAIGEGGRRVERYAGGSARPADGAEGEGPAVVRAARIPASEKVVGPVTPGGFAVRADSDDL